jgi:hypothetical protein
MWRSRQNRRSVATFWLLLQVLSVSVFAVRTCCLPAPAASLEADADCPMQHEDGATCPMHRAKPKDAPCSMRAACQGEMAGLAAVFIHNGVPADVFVLLADESASASLRPAPFALLQPPAATDTPPPRS